MEELTTLADSINTLYRKQGYLTTQVYIPPQNIDGGVITLQVIEGRISAVSITGNRFYRNPYILARVNQQAGEILNFPKLEETLNRMNRQERFRTKAVLSPGLKAGETNVELRVTEKLPFQIAPTFDNQGRPFIGMLRWGTEVSNDSLFGFGDRLSVKWEDAKGTDMVSSSYTIPLNRYGTELSFLFGFGHVDIDLNRRNQPDIDGFAYNYSVFLSQPLGKSRAFSVDTGLNFRRISTFISGEKDGTDDISSLQFGVNYSKPDRYGFTSARIQTTVAPSWLGANRQFWKNEFLANRVFRLPLGNVLILRGYAQLTPDALPSAEQFQVGGAFSVRGYTEGLLIGDRGYSFGIEDRFPVPGLKYVSPWLAKRVQGAVFFDMGQTWLDRSSQFFEGGVSNSAERTLLMSVGMGVRAQLTRYLQGFVDFGFGLVDRSRIEANGQPTARLHFGVRSNLLPEYLPERFAKKPPKSPKVTASR